MISFELYLASVENKLTTYLGVHRLAELRRTWFDESDFCILWESSGEDDLQWYIDIHVDMTAHGNDYILTGLYNLDAESVISYILVTVRGEVYIKTTPSRIYDIIDILLRDKDNRDVKTIANELRNYQQIGS
jgi:hypothetical protein